MPSAQDGAAVAADRALAGNGGIGPAKDVAGAVLLDRFW
jgi:hypothetical protein